MSLLSCRFHGWLFGCAQGVKCQVGTSDANYQTWLKKGGTWFPINTAADLNGDGTISPEVTTATAIGRIGPPALTLAATTNDYDRLVFGGGSIGTVESVEVT
jgi:hypothetical protein